MALVAVPDGLRRDGFEGLAARHPAMTRPLIERHDPCLRPRSALPLVIGRVGCRPRELPGTPTGGAWGYRSCPARLRCWVEFPG
jgi:hypothetical protein